MSESAADMVTKALNKQLTGVNTIEQQQLVALIFIASLLGGMMDELKSIQELLKP